MSLNLYLNPLNEEHDAGHGHPESPRRIPAILDALGASPLDGRVKRIAAVPAPAAAVTAVHSSSYLDLLRTVQDQGGGALDSDTVMNSNSFDAALCAAGAAIAAAESALNGVPSFAAVRPPGHHALAARAMGFCLLNNVVIAARRVLELDAAARVLIIDWDVHHGNGTQALVERDPRIRYVSLHQYPHYPGTGTEAERGVGNIFNVPRPPGLPPETYVTDLRAAVDNARRNWEPDIILISAGFDAMRGDPLGGFTLEPDDYARLTRQWKELGVPMASVLEGGYDPDRLAQGVLAHLKALLA